MIEGTQTTSTATIARGLDLWINRLGRQFGPLSRPQRRALRTLHDLSATKGQVRVSDLAEALGVTSAGATRMLNKLEELGYVGRSRESDGDQREVAVALSAAGKQALEAANAVYFSRVGDELRRLDESERETLARLLARLTASAPD